MIINFIKLTFRNLFRQKTSSLINILGLSLGIGCFTLISLFVYDEHQYDMFHEKGERIYRLSSNMFNPERHMAHLPARFYPHIKESLPEAEKTVRIHSSRVENTLQYEENEVEGVRGLYADPDILEMFSFNIISGSSDHFADNVQGAFITESLANKLFGHEDAVGKSYSFMQHGRTFTFIVTGVIENVPKHSHLQFDVLYNIDYMRSVNAHMFESWGNFSCAYYLLVREDADVSGIPAKLKTIYSEANMPGFARDIYFFKLQQLHDIYLNSDEIETPFTIATGNRSAIFIFSASAILVLILACFNYVNLSSAKSTMRSREVGVRKVVGANKGQLIRYFLAESFVVSLIAMIISLVLLEVTFPYFNQIAGKEISFSSVNQGTLAMMLAGLLVVVSVLSGTYPAFILSRFNPVTVLKGSNQLYGKNYKKGSSLRFRQLLIVLQFAISIGLVSSSFVLYKQTDYALKHSGFEKDFLIVVRNHFGTPMKQIYRAFQNEIKQYPFVTHVSAGTNVPTDNVGNQGYLLQPHQSQEEAHPVYLSPVDFGYFEALGAKLLSGRLLDVKNATDSTDVVILNETAARVMGLTDSLGVMLTGFWDGHDKRLIGIVEDIHFQSVHLNVMPIAFFVLHEFLYQPPASYKMLVRFSSQNFTEVIEAVEKSWYVANSGRNPIDYYFMDERYENMYRVELQTAKTSRIFTLLAIIVACMGLIGTTIYVMEARKKEFGIRKVLGASTMRLSGMISKEFSVLIILSNIIAWPVTFYFMSKWLDNFVYRIDISMWWFVLAGLFGLALALILVNSLAINQASKNPVETIKYE